MKRTSLSSGFLLPVATLAVRELVRFCRQRNRIVGALGTPLVFWFLIGSGFGASFQPPSAPGGMSYLQYFFPGTLALVLLFTSIFSTISLIEDRREGFLQSVLVAPVSRTSIVLGKVLGGTILALLHGSLFLVVAPVAGISLNIVSVISLVGILSLIAFALTALGFAIAWRTDSTQGFHAIMNLVLMPLWLLSGAVFPASGASSWLRWAMTFNPLTYGVAALRWGLHPATAGSELPSLALSLGVTVLFGVLAVWAAAVIAGRTAGVLP